MKILVGFYDHDKDGVRRDFSIMKRGTKYIIVMEKVGVNYIIGGWKNSKREASAALQELANKMEGKV